MNRDNVRSLGVFLAVVLVLTALVLGGVYFAKSRSANYARPAQQPAVANNNQPDQNKDSNQQQSQPQSQPTPSTNQQTPQQQPAAAQPQTTQPQPAASPAPKETTTASNSQVPATGPSDFFVVSALVMATVYSLISLRRARLSMRRLLS